MGWFEYTVIYIISWWMVLFMVLPYKADVPDNPELSEYHGAPKQSYLAAKLVVTTILAALVTIGLSAMIKHGIITLWMPYRF